MRCGFQSEFRRMMKDDEGWRGKGGGGGEEKSDKKAWEME